MEVLDIIKGFGLELTDEQEKQIKQSIGKEFVLKSDFNTKINNLKLAEEKVKELEKRDFSSIEKERDDYKTKFETLQKEKDDSVKKNKFFEALGDCKDKEYILFKAGGLDKLEIDDHGSIKDIETITSSLKEENPMDFERTPFVVSKTDGPNIDVSDEKQKANEALRNLV